MPELPPTTTSPPGGPQRPHASGREALLVFLGTFGAAALVLIAVVLVAPERFGLSRTTGDDAQDIGGANREEGRDAGGSTPGEPSRDSFTGVDPALAPGAPRVPDSGPDSGPGSVRQDLAQVDPWPQFDRGFAPRPTDTEANPFAPRPYVERAFAKPSLAQRIFEDARASVAHVTTLTIRSQAAPSGSSAAPPTGAGSASDDPVVQHDRVAGTGSGLVWDRSGHIVTSRHVIENAGGANVTLADGSVWRAKLIGVDHDTDIAVLQIAALPDRLTPIRVGTSHDLSVGMSVFSIACPYGIGHSLSTGSISGLNRRIQSTIARDLRGTIQTDAPLHPGSSGGALIDDQARVIGMNAAIHLDSGRAPGVGFALPIDRLQVVVPALIRDGHHWYPEFGFMTESAERSRARLAQIEEEIGRSELPGAAPLALSGELPVPPSGLVVTEIDASGPADGAGLRGVVRLENKRGRIGFFVRDVVVEAGGVEVQSANDIEQAIESLLPGEPLALSIWRRGSLVPVSIERLPR